MPRALLVLILTSVLLPLSAQEEEDLEESLEIFEEGAGQEQEEESEEPTENLEIFEQGETAEEELEIFDDETELEGELEILGDEAESEKAPDVLAQAEEPGAADRTPTVFDQFLQNTSFRTVSRYHYFFNLIDAEESASPEPDRQQHMFEQHIEFSTFVAADILRFDITTFVNIGNQENTYVAKFASIDDWVWQDWLQDTYRERHYFDLSSLYMSLFLPVCDIYVGKKTFVNTLSSLHTPADNYRATDGNDPFDPKDYGKLLVQADFFIGDLTLSAVIFPIYQGGKVFSPLSRWGYYKAREVADEEGTDIDTGDESERQYPDITWENISYLLKLKAPVLGFDLFLACFYGLAGNNVSRVVSEGPPKDKDSEVIPVLNASFGFATAIEKFELHGEALFNYSIESKDDDYLRYVAGFRFTIDEIFLEVDFLEKIEITLEYGGEWLIQRQSHPSYENSTEDRRFAKNDLIGLIGIQFSEKLNLNIFGQYELPSPGLLLAGDLSFQMLDDVEIAIGGQFFLASETSNYYYWRHNNRVLATVTYDY